MVNPNINWINNIQLCADSLRLLFLEKEERDFLKKLKVLDQNLGPLEISASEAYRVPKTRSPASPRPGTI